MCGGSLWERSGWWEPRGRSTMVPGVCLPSMSCTAHAGRAQRSCGASIRPVQHSRLLGTDKHSFGGAVQRRRGSTCVARSFLGVGAPEAILIVGECGNHGNGGWKADAAVLLKANPNPARSRCPQWCH